jgi:hypothetical protein
MHCRHGRFCLDTIEAMADHPSRPPSGELCARTGYFEVSNRGEVLRKESNRGEVFAVDACA